MKQHPLLVTLILSALLLASGCKQAAVDPDTTQAPDEPFSFHGTVLEIHDGRVLVEAVEGDDIRRSADKISFATAELPDIDAHVGDIVGVTYDGTVMESYPAQVNASDWSIVRKYMESSVQLTAPEVFEYGTDTFHMTLSLPAGWWHYEIPEDERAITGADGIMIDRQLALELAIYFEYHETPVGICGTGVTFEVMTFDNGYTATACTELLGDGSYWFYLIYDEPYAGYVVSCTAPYELWQEYEAEVMSILNTLAFGSISE